MVSGSGVCGVPKNLEPCLCECGTQIVRSARELSVVTDTTSSRLRDLRGECHVNSCLVVELQRASASAVGCDLSIPLTPNHPTDELTKVCKDLLTGLLLK